MTDDPTPATDLAGGVPFVPVPLDRRAVTYVAGHRGLVGSAVWRRFEQDGFTSLVGRTSAELDLINHNERPVLSMVISAKMPYQIFRPCEQ